MTTMVDKQNDFFKSMEESLELDYNAIEAYETAINSLENNEFNSNRTDIIEGAVIISQNGFKDEKRHKTWLE